MKLFYLSKSSQRSGLFIFLFTFILIVTPIIIQIPVKYSIAIMLAVSIISYFLKTPEIILSCFIFLFGSIVNFTNPYNYIQKIVDFIKPEPAISINDALNKKPLEIFRLKNSNVRFDLEGRTTIVQKMFNYNKKNIYRVMPVVNKENWDKSQSVSLWAFCDYYRSDQYCAELWDDLENKQVKLTYLFDTKFKEAISESIKNHGLIIPANIKYLDVHQDTEKPWHIAFLVSSFLLWLIGTFFFKEHIL